MNYPSDSAPSAEHPDLAWARGRVTHARSGASVSLFVAIAASLGAVLIEVLLARPSIEVALTAAFSAVIVIGCLIQRSMAGTYLTTPVALGLNKLGRTSWRKTITLLWAMFVALAVISIASLVHLAVTGQLIFTPIFGAILAAACFAGPSGALLDASRVTTLITGR